MGAWAGLLYPPHDPPGRWADDPNHGGDLTLLARAAILALALAPAGCATDFTPPVPQGRAARAVGRWLADVGQPDPANGFGKGQQEWAAVTGAYGYNTTPGFSYLVLQLTDFRYTLGGEPRSFTGKAVATLRRQPDRRWAVERLALESEGGQVLHEFRPPEVIEVDP